MPLIKKSCEKIMYLLLVGISKAKDAKLVGMGEHLKAVRGLATKL